MKKNILFTVIGFILGLSVAVGAAYLYNAKDIEFNASSSEFEATNVEDALNDLFRRIRITNIPFIVIFGNHDHQFDMTQNEQWDFFRTYTNNDIICIYNIGGVHMIGLQETIKPSAQFFPLI